MDYLQEARGTMDWAEDDSITQEAALWYFAKAQAHAAIAQTEQLKRIADMLANYFEIMVDGAITNDRE